MRQSQLFTKTRKDAPKDEVSKNAQLLIRAGFIHKEMAGVYDLMPLGLRVMRKIEKIIREEMNAIGGQEIEMTALQDPAMWSKTDRWNKIDVWFTTKLKGGADLGLAPTHEEPLTYLLTNFVHSYKDLPLYAYQFQTKFRNELRSKSGMMRGREFYMKDLYSFSKNEEEHNDFYEKSKIAYSNIFKRAGIGDQTYLTVADGGSFGDSSHEFQTITEAGEDTIYVDEEKKIAINDEVYNDETISKLGLNKESLVEKKAVEVGNIFPLGTKFSDALGLKFDNEEGKPQSVIMGSYGIGLGRLMGTVVEVLSDEKGIVWPEEIAPFKVHLILLSVDSENSKQVAEKLYKDLEEKGVEVLFDDRNVRPGEKFADSELIGIPTQIVVGEKGLEKGILEIKDRKSGEVTEVAQSDILATITT